MRNLIAFLVINILLLIVILIYTSNKLIFSPQALHILLPCSTGRVRQWSEFEDSVGILFCVGFHAIYLSWLASYRYESFRSWYIIIVSVSGSHYSVARVLTKRRKKDC